MQVKETQKMEKRPPSPPPAGGGGAAVAPALLLRAAAPDAPILSTGSAPALLALLPAPGNNTSPFAALTSVGSKCAALH